jgi:hypothetical protein
MKAVSLCNDPAFALRFGEAVRSEDLSVALLIAGAAETVEYGRTQYPTEVQTLRASPWNYNTETVTT